ncbi:MAG: Fic family protein [Bacteroidia bacterium]
MNYFSDIKFLKADYLDQYKKALKANLTKAFAAVPERNDSFDALKKRRRNFDFYIATASTYSSNIEGNPITVDSFLKHAAIVALKHTKDIKEIEDLVKAYRFAKGNTLNKNNFLKSHLLLSTKLLAPVHRGKLRKSNIVIMSSNGIEYSAIEYQSLKKEFDAFFSDVKTLINQELSIEEVFYFASMIHFQFEHLHPFVDGNGRSGRLLEKWFLAEKLGEKAFNIESEKYYWKKRPSYYKNLKIGNHYSELNYDLSIPFLLMLPQSLAK